MARRFEIVFEDDQLIVINKSAGVLTIADRYNPDLPNLKATLSRTREAVFVVHRIDKDTSGLVIFCKTAEMHQAMSALFEARKIKKTYQAITQGRPEANSGTIDVPILVNKDRAKVTISNKGKDSLTHYRVIEQFKNYSFLEIDLLTGRRHQIRAHLSSISCPIVADKMYGTSGEFYLSHIKKKQYNLKKYEIERPLISRQALHAHSIEFIDPISQNEMQFNIDPPKDMRALLTQLRKLNS